MAKKGGETYGTKTHGNYRGVPIPMPTKIGGGGASVIQPSEGGEAGPHAGTSPKGEK